MNDRQFPSLLDRTTDLTSRAVGDIGRSRVMPPGFSEGSEGLVTPERLGETEPTITLTGRVHEEMFKNLSIDLGKLERENKQRNKLKVDFSSFGGSVVIGFGVHDMLRVFARRHNIPIEITGFGPIMSMGVLILQAGDVRKMPENSRMLLHPVSTRLEGEVDRIEYELAESKYLYTTYAEIVSSRVKKAGKNTSADDILTLMKANSSLGTRLSSREALELGLIDEIV